MTIARQLGLDPSTVSNFFMNARRRSVDKWKDDSLADDDQLDDSHLLDDMTDDEDDDDMMSSSDELSQHANSHHFQLWHVSGDWFAVRPARTAGHEGTKAMITPPNSLPCHSHLGTT